MRHRKMTIRMRRGAGAGAGPAAASSHRHASSRPPGRGGRPSPAPSSRHSSFVLVPGSALGGGRDAVVEAMLAATARGQGSHLVAHGSAHGEEEDPRQRELVEKQRRMFRRATMRQLRSVHG